MQLPMYPHQELALSKMGNGKILVGGVGAGKTRVALEYYVNTKLTPRKLSCVWLSIDSDFLTVNDDRVVCCLYSVLALTVLASEATLSCIILKKVSQHFWRCKVVDSNYLITLCLKHLTESQTTDTAEAVNSNFCHFV